MRGNPPGGRADALACAAIAASGALLAVLLRPFQDAPYVDDWAYAWSVERLVHGGGLRLLDWSAHPDVAHLLWGALFCLPAGFSFAALRMSTFALAVAGL